MDGGQTWSTENNQPTQEIYRIAERSGGGVCTIGSCTTKPGIVTSVVAECRMTLDQRTRGLLGV